MSFLFEQLHDVCFSAANFCCCSFGKRIHSSFCLTLFSAMQRDRRSSNRTLLSGRDALLQSDFVPGFILDFVRVALFVVMFICMTFLSFGLLIKKFSLLTKGPFLFAQVGRISFLSLRVEQGRYYLAPSSH